MSRNSLACVLVILFTACAPSGAHTTAQATLSPSPATSPSPTPSSSPSPSPSPSAAAPVQPSTLPVTFAGLPNGTYPTHLHSICNGTQNFHITVLQTLVVRGGSGTIEVPAGYFGRGLCVIVYGSPSLTTVVSTRQI